MCESHFREYARGIGTYANDQIWSDQAFGSPYSGDAELPFAAAQRKPVKDESKHELCDHVSQHRRRVNPGMDFF